MPSSILQPISQLSKILGMGESSSIEPATVRIVSKQNHDALTLSATAIDEDELRRHIGDEWIVAGRGRQSRRGGGDAATRPGDGRHDDNRRGRGYYDGMTCRYCGKQGHRFKDCRAPGARGFIYRQRRQWDEEERERAQRESRSRTASGSSAGTAASGSETATSVSAISTQTRAGLLSAAEALKAGGPTTGDAGPSRARVMVNSPTTGDAGPSRAMTSLGTTASKKRPAETATGSTPEAKTARQSEPRNVADIYGRVNQLGEDYHKYKIYVTKEDRRTPTSPEETGSVRLGIDGRIIALSRRNMEAMEEKRYSDVQPVPRLTAMTTEAVGVRGDRYSVVTFPRERDMLWMRDFLKEIGFDSVTSVDELPKWHKLTGFCRGK
jgi:hypothetical protein